MKTATWDFCRFWDVISSYIISKYDRNVFPHSFQVVARASLVECRSKWTMLWVFSAWQCLTEAFCWWTSPFRPPWLLMWRAAAFSELRFLAKDAKNDGAEDGPKMGHSTGKVWSIYPLVNVYIAIKKSPFLMGRLTISMAMFNSYVKLPEGKGHQGTSKPYICLVKTWAANLELQKRGWKMGTGPPSDGYWLMGVMMMN